MMGIVVVLGFISHRKSVGKTRVVSFRTVRRQTNDFYVQFKKCHLSGNYCYSSKQILCEIVQPEEFK